MFKRFVSILLCLVMLFAMLSVCAFAADEEQASGGSEETTGGSVNEELETTGDLDGKTLTENPETTTGDSVNEELETTGDSKTEESEATENSKTEELETTTEEQTVDGASVDPSLGPGADDPDVDPLTETSTSVGADKKFNDKYYAVVGQSVTLLSATAATDASSVKGSVTFYADSNKVGTANIVNTKGVYGASFAYKFTSKGVHTIKAVYGGDTDHQGSESVDTAITVYEPTTTTLTSSASWGKLGTTFTLTALLKNSSKAAVSGKNINFRYATSSSTTYAKATKIATVTTDANGKSSCTWTPKANGTYYVFAGFDGDDGEFYYASLGKITITVSNVAPAGDDFNAPLWIAVVLLSVGTGSYMLLRRKKYY